MGRSRDAFDALHEAYDEQDPRASGYRSRYVFDRERAMILGCIRSYLAPEGRVLDIGCGAGLVSGALARSVRVFGLDDNHSAAVRARANRLMTVRGDAFRLPYRTGVFHVALVAEVIQQFTSAQVQDLLSEIARVTIAGGFAVVAWRNGKALAHRVVQPAFALVDRLAGRPPLKLIDHSPQCLADAAASAGMAVEKVDAIFPPFAARWPGTRATGRILGTSYLAVLRREA